MQAVTILKVALCFVFAGVVLTQTRTKLQVDLIGATFSARSNTMNAVDSGYESS